MSLLSQFFPSGGGGQAKIKTNMLLVGGGGGGLSASPILPCSGGGRPCQAMSGTSGGGGGAGEAYIFKNYAISSGAEITVTIGSGGATSSNGGTSSICITNENSVTASGGKGTITQCSSAFEITYSALENASYGGGNGGRGPVCYCPSPTVPGASQSACCGSVASFSFCGQPSLLSCTSPGSPTCIFNYGDDGIVIKGRSSSGGTTGGGLPGLSSLSMSGGGGGGGGGASCAGSSGCPADPGNNNTGSPITCFRGGPGGPGGPGLCSDILGSIQSFAAGGGGGGGNTTLNGPVPIGAVPVSPAEATEACARPSVGTSPTGGCGGQASIYGSNFPALIPLCNGCPGCDGTANFGGGGGGGGWGWFSTGTGGSGGSGIVVIQYPTQYSVAPAFPGACDCSPATPGCRTYKFNGPGSITLP